MTENFNLAHALWHYSVHTPHAIALVHQGRQFSYTQLAQRASALAAALPRALSGSGGDAAVPRVAILAARGVDACVAVAAACWAGVCWVPIDIQLPPARIEALLKASSLDALVADTEGEELLYGKVLAACPALLIRTGQLSPQEPQQPLSAEFCHTEPMPVGAQALACILFVPGSYGVWRGVMVTARALSHYLHAAAQVFRVAAADRVLEAGEFSHGSFIHTLLSTWQAGATLYLLPESRAIHVVNFARENRLTVWNSSSSLAAQLMQLRVLAPACLAGLRLVLLGGEPLPAALAATWMQAAPQASLYHLHGCTEVPVFSLQHRVNEASLRSAVAGLLALGQPMPGTEARVVSAKGRTLADGAPGELALAGEQLALGYLGQGYATEMRFPVVRKKRWHLTGDRVMRDASGTFHWLGRSDNQISVQGTRVDLDEVDAALCKVLGITQAAAVGWPCIHGMAQGIVGFVVLADILLRPALTALRQILPPCAVPDRILSLSALPLSRGGRPDRDALLRLLDPT